MASDSTIQRRADEFGDLHFLDEDGRDNWNVNVGGSQAYVLVRKTENGQAVVHGNIDKKNLPDLFIEWAFNIAEL